MHKVSLIAPIYNVEKYIPRFLESVFNQTYENIEYIFVDDASPDNSISILEEYVEKHPERRDNVKILHNPQNLGLTKSRNVGLREATGDYIYHCDSDDWLDQEMIQLMVETSVKENADVVICDSVHFSEDKTETYRTVDWIGNKEISITKYILSEWTTIWNILAKKELYTRFNLMSPENINFCEDFHLSVRLLFHANRVIRLPKPLYFYNRMNSNSITHIWDEKRYKSEIQTYLDIIEFFKDHHQYKQFSNVMNWRIQRAKLHLLLDSSQKAKFRDTLPQYNKNIINNPLLTKKVRLVGWLVINNTPVIPNFLLYLRKLFF